MKKSIRYSQVHGFSMVEIMLAITISLILLLGLLQTFISNKNNYRLETAYNTMHENARFSYDYLSKILRNTAYRSPQQDTIFTSMNTLFDATNLYIDGTNNTGTNNSDSMTIRYQGSGDGAGNADNTIRDCLNIGVDSFVTTTLTFSISANDELQCRAQNPSSANTDNTQVILPDVENMQILYGEDLNGDKAPNRFVESSHPNINMANVVAIKVSILLRSDIPVSPTVNTTTYNLNGTTQTAPGDNFLRQPITFTIMLRNVITEVTA
tara:strand:+ start:47523 stop:48323 length:801 start_codon:yes stop_codon:yes gene_type:complete